MSPLEEYVSAGGGRALALARRHGPDWVAEQVHRSGLRGRGGAGFPTGLKWRTVRDDASPTKYVVCNAAEGEPGAFKDRWLLRHDPYVVLEGLAVAAFALGAEGGWICLKAGAEREVERVRTAMLEMAGADLLGDVPVELLAGPDEYLFGEEKALLEVIEGNPPLPRTVPPWMEGLFRSPDHPQPDGRQQPGDPRERARTSCAKGRSGSARSELRDSPGTMLLTLSGDVRYPGVYELPMGFSLTRADPRHRRRSARGTRRSRRCSPAHRARSSLPSSSRRRCPSRR